MSVSGDATSLPHMAFAELLVTVQLLDRKGRVPDAFINSLHSYAIVTSDFDIAIRCTFLADSIRAYRYLDPLHPFPGPSQGGDSLIPFMQRIVTSLGSSSALVTIRASALCHGGNVVSSGVGLGSVVPASVPPSFPLPSLAPPSSYPLIFVPPDFSSSSFIAPSGPLLPPSSPHPSLSSSVIYSVPYLTPAPPPGFPLAPPVRPVTPSLSLHPVGPAFSFSPLLLLFLLLYPLLSPIPPPSVPAPHLFPPAPVLLLRTVLLFLLLLLLLSSPGPCCRFLSAQLFLSFPWLP